MPNKIRHSVGGYATGLVLLGLCALAAPAAEPGPYEPPVKNENSSAVQTPATVIRDWPERPRDAARALIAKYGEPSSFDDDRLVWYGIGPWQETAVYREAPESSGHRGEDILEQSISYIVPEKELAELNRFDRRLDFDKPSGELVARSESENLNYLALNLADEIVNGKRTADEARDFYRKTLKLAASGKTSAYMERLLFPPRRRGSGASSPIK